MDFIFENALQAAIWPLLKQIAANRKIKNKAKNSLTLYQQIPKLHTSPSNKAKAKQIGKTP